MEKCVRIFALFLISAVAGCTVTSSSHDNYSGQPPTELVVKVTCSDPGMQFTGAIVSDGVRKEVSGTGSTTFHASGHKFICSFKKTGAAGQISINVSEGGSELGVVSNGGKFGGVRAEIVHSSIARESFQGHLNIPGVHLNADYRSGEESRSQIFTTF